MCMASKNECLESNAKEEGRQLKSKRETDKDIEKDWEGEKDK